MCKLRFSHQFIMLENAVIPAGIAGQIGRTADLLAPKLLLGNAVLEAPASRQDGKQELVRDGFPSRSLGTSGNRKIRLFGMDAEIQANGR